MTEPNKPQPATMTAILAHGIPVVVCPRCQYWALKPHGFERDKNLRVCLHCPGEPALDVVYPSHRNPR